MGWRRIAGLTAAIAIASTGFAVPAAADTSPTATATTWEMPDVRKMVLAKAFDDLRAAAPAGVKIKTIDQNGNRDQLNLTNWIVCWVWPKQGTEVPMKSKAVSLGVSRPNEKCW